MKLIEVLPKIAQYETAEYAADFRCQECGKSGFPLPNVDPPMEKPRFVGWADTNYGFQGIFECPCCGSRFRFHCASPASDLDTFDFRAAITYVDRCSNGDELNDAMDRKTRLKYDNNGNVLK